MFACACFEMWPLIAFSHVNIYRQCFVYTEVNWPWILINILELLELSWEEAGAAISLVLQQMASNKSNNEATAVCAFHYKPLILDTIYIFKLCKRLLLIIHRVLHVLTSAKFNESCNNCSVCFCLHCNTVTHFEIK